MIDIPRTIDRALQLSKADDCIVIARRASSVNVRWANNTSTTNGMAEGNTLVVTSIIDGRVGTVARTYFPDDELESIVRESEAACEGKPKAEDYMPLLPPDDDARDWSDPVEATSISVFDRFAPELADLFGRATSTGINLFGYAEHGLSTTWLATSTGLRRRHTHPEGKVEVTAKTDGFTRSSWAGQQTSSFRDVDLDHLYRKLQQRLEWSKNTLEVPAGRYEVLLEPSATADMLIYMIFMASAREADEGRTVFSKPGGGNRIGEKMFADGVGVYSDPHEQGMETAPFLATSGSSSYASVFDNGLRTAKTEWVRDGTLANLITTRYWAERSGASGPVPFIANLVFPAQGPTLDDMIERTQRALLVTCFWYIRVVDPQTLLLTGLTRDGVFLVEGGEVKGAVNNFRYNMSPVQMLAQTTEIGGSGPTLPREFDEFGLTKMPPIRVRDFNMSSVSEAT